MNTSVARTIEINTDHIAYDASCKRLLSEKCILAWIMKYCVSECSEMDIDDIVRCIEAPEISSVPIFSDETNAPRINGMNTVESSRYEGTVTFDLRFAASIPSPKRTISLIINVEAQADFHPGYPLPARAEYYCARLISAQKGTTFVGSHYEYLRKVYSIWICTEPPKHRENSISATSSVMKGILGRISKPLEGYGLQCTSFIMLGDEEEKEAQAVLRLLDVLFTSEKEVAERKRILEEEFHIPINDNIEKEMDHMCNLSKGVENRGIRKGIRIGMDQGITKGHEEERLNSIRSLMETLNLTLDQAMQALKIPGSEREKYLQMFAQQEDQQRERSC